jgi:hypothetical protein
MKSTLGGSVVYPSGPSYLFVPVEQEADARRVIAVIESREFALDDDADVGTDAEA